MENDCALRCWEGKAVYIPYKLLRRLRIHSNIDTLAVAPSGATAADAHKCPYLGCLYPLQRRGPSMGINSEKRMLKNMNRLEEIQIL